MTADDGERVTVAVLGPLRVTGPDGRDRTPAGELQRRLLALLVLHRGQVVSMDAAVDVLWPSAPPRDPAGAIHNHVSRLRSVLPDTALERTGEGYRLDPAALDLDLEILAGALAADEDDEPAAAALAAALEHWRGPAYPELVDHDDGRLEAHRLDELRRRAREELAARRLAQGSTAGLVAELQELVDEDPLRERPRALLVEVLATEGRTADALRAYDDFRRRLGDELGTAPSPAFTARHAELLGGGDGRGWTPAHRLPAPPTRLLGRAPLVDGALAASRAHRLVTLLGPGGVGKTRLAVDLGHRLSTSAADRPVVFCELASSGPDDVHDAVGDALAISPRAGVPSLERVVDALGDHPVTVILDNCEHVLEAVAELTERVLARCPEVHVIATSRERLRVGGEHLVPVTPLALGTVDAPAVELFLERARAVSTDLDPDDGELATIVELVARLDGLPLAIELAASRLQTHDIAEVAAGLDRRFSLLATGARTADRHRSLGAAVEWSYELLDPALQRVFTDLSVFAGSFTAAAAAEVTGLEPVAARDALDQLVERSLLVRRPDRRYQLLETLRAFGAERLEDDGRAAPVRGRHARQLVAWLDALVAGAPDPAGDRTLLDIEEALPDLRAVLGYLLDQGDVERAGELVTLLFDFGFFRLRPDVLEWSERVIELDPEDTSPWAPSVRAVAGYAAWMAGDLDELGRAAARAVALAEARSALTAVVAGAWASHALFEGRLEAAREWYERGGALPAASPTRRMIHQTSALLARAYADDPGAPAAATALLDEVGSAVAPYAAYAWYGAGESDQGIDVERALVRHTRALELAEATGTTIVAALARTSRASIEARVGDADAAVRDFRRLLDDWRRAGMWSSQWTMLRSVAGLLARLGKAQEAAVLLGAILQTDAGHRIFGADETALRDLTQHLQEALGEEAWATAFAAGAELDGDAAVELARRSL